MAAVSGKDATITYANGYTYKSTAWTINAVAEEVDTTALGDKWKSFLAGVKEWSGTYDAIIDSSKLDTGVTVGKATDSGLGLGAAAASGVFTFDSSGDAKSLEGDIIITGVDASAAVASGPNTFTFTFRGTGDLNIQ